MARRRAVAKNMLGGKCPLWVGKLDPQAVARKLDEKDAMNQLIAKRKKLSNKED